MFKIGYKLLKIKQILKYFNAEENHIFLRNKFSLLPVIKISLFAIKLWVQKDTVRRLLKTQHYVC